MDKELVSVIMSTYNEPEIFLKKSIESILNQTYSNIEFIIVCDNPENSDIIKILNIYKNTDKRINIIINETNIGLVKSLNKALIKAQGTFIARMDADDIAQSERINKQLNYIKTNNFDMIGSAILCIDKNENEIRKINNMPKNFNKFKKYIIINNCIAHPTWFGRIEVFKKNKGYRNIPYAEDYDFVLRAIEKGFKLGNINQVLLKYRIREDSISNKNGLKQFLISEYLVKMYKNKSLDKPEKELIAEIKAIIKRISDEESNKYYFASLNFIKAVKKIKNLNPLWVIYFFASIKYSKYYRKKIINYIRTFL